MLAVTVILFPWSSQTHVSQPQLYVGETTRGVVNNLSSRRNGCNSPLVLGGNPHDCNVSKNWLLQVARAVVKAREWRYYTTRVACLPGPLERSDVSVRNDDFLSEVGSHGLF